MNSKLKKILFTITAAVTLQPGSSICTASQWGQLVLEASENAFNGTCKAIQTVTQHRTTQQVVDVIKSKSGEWARATLVVAFFSGLLAAASVRSYCKYRDFLKRAEGAKPCDEGASQYNSKAYWLKRAFYNRRSSILCALGAAYEAYLAATCGISAFESLPLAADFAIESAASAL